MKKNVLIGFEIKTGEKVFLAPDHLIVTGVTQYSGKTTCLESLIQRLGVKAIAFRTKLGEKSFIQGTIIPPFFKDKSDWQFIQSLLEATLGERLKGWDRSKIIQLSKGTNSLLEFKKKVDERLNEKLNAFEKDILTNLQAYLEIVLPKLQSITFSNELDLVEGVNIIDLERFSRDVDVQSLVIRSVIEEVFHKYKNTIVILPEAPKFLPQKRGNPCKIVVEQFIREGATDNKLLWVDSQDMASTDKIPLKQISTWILGYQSEINEVKHTILQIPLPSSKKPKPDDIMTLKLGEFYVCTRDFVKKVYAMPFWLDENKARKVALGKIKVTELDAPETLTPFKIARKEPEKVTEQPSIDFEETSKRFNKELIEMRQDFFNKIEDIQQQMNKIASELFNLKNQPKQEINEEELISKVLQKLPSQSSSSVTSVSVDEEAIISKVLARVPSGAKVYEVAPLVKIKKDFLEEAKNKLLSDISSCDEKQKKMLKWMEQKGSYATKKDIFYNCFGSGATSGGTYQDLVKKLTDMKQKEILKIDTHNRVYPILKLRIKQLIEQYGATEDEIENVYSHIIMELLGGKNEG